MTDLRSRLLALSPDGFEWLVHALVRAEEEDAVEVRKLRPPDDGADTLVLRKDGSVRIVVQAKRHAARINWVKCESSLDKAVTRWRPEEVRFAFVCDFTKADQNAFKSRLVDRARDTRVTAWTLSDLERLLGNHQTVGPRFLGIDARSVTEAIERASKLGGLSLSNTNDLLARAQELARFGDEVDPHFVYGVVAGSNETPLPRWDKLPTMSVCARKGNTRVTLAAWPRYGGEEGAMIRFTEDAEGRHAKEQVRRALAAGSPITVVSGVAVERPSTPKLHVELEDKITWTTEFSAPKAVFFNLQCESPHGMLDLNFELRAIPPHPPYIFTFASLQDGVWFEISLLEDTASTGRISLYLGTEFGESASANLQIAQSFLRWITRTSLRSHGPLGRFTQEFQHGLTSPGEVRECLEKIELFKMTIDLEEAFRGSLRFPRAPTVADVQALRTAHRILKQRGQRSPQEPKWMFVDPSDIAAIAQEIGHPRSKEFRVTLRLFGEILDFGIARQTWPAMHLSDVQPISTEPLSVARIQIVADGESEWRLIEPTNLVKRKETRQC